MITPILKRLHRFIILCFNLCNHKNRLFKRFLFIIIFFGLYSLAFSQGVFLYQSKGRRNPFIPLVTKEGRLIKLDKEEGKGKTDLLVDGIIYDKQGVSYALVNGRVVGVGDYAGEYRVLKITKDKVAFLRDDQIREVLIDDKESE